MKIIKILIIRFVFAIVILSILVYSLSKLEYKKDVYIIKYDTYQYNPYTHKRDLDRKDCEFTLKGLSDKDVSDKLIEMEYLNNLCISDSVAIKEIIKF